MGVIKKYYYIIIFIVFIMLLVGVSLYRYYAYPIITLDGSSVVYLNYKDKYVENGYSATYLNDDVTEDVKIIGKVNTSKLGTYTIKYKINNVYVERVVIVEDLERPVIEVSSDDIYICPDTKYEKVKVKAHDNVDGDLSDKVKIKLYDDMIIYRVKDKSGNSTEVKRKIIEKDVVKPEMTFNGSDVLYGYVGEDINDPSVKVVDNCDGDISDNVKVDSNVDTKKSGTYFIKYSVSDKEGNDASLERKVFISEKSKNGVVYLTFDDGPQSGTTDVILDILKEEGVKATFFVTSKGPDELIKREFDEGHTVALHTSSHNYQVVYASDQSFFNDLGNVSDRVKRITGVESKIIRFPGGSSNTISRRYSVGIMSRITNEVLNRGYRYYDWNISSGDAGETRDPNQVYANVVNNLRRDRANMILMHDIKPYTRDALRKIIRYCKDNGYRMEKIDMNTEMIRQKVNN